MRFTLCMLLAVICWGWAPQVRYGRKIRMGTWSEIQQQIATTGPTPGRRLLSNLIVLTGAASALLAVW